MSKNITFIILCCLSWAVASAQTPADINRRLDTIAKSIDIISKDEKLSKDCREKIKPFKKYFAQKDTASLKGKNIKTLVQQANKFVQLLEPTGKLVCNDTQIKKLAGTTRELITALKKIDTAAEAKQATGIIDSTKVKSVSNDSSKNGVTVNPEVPDLVNNMGEDQRTKIPGIVPDLSGIQYSEMSTLVIAVPIIIGVVILLAAILVLYYKKASDYKIITKEMEELKIERTNIPVVEGPASQPEKSSVPALPLIGEVVQETPGEAIKTNDSFIPPVETAINAVSSIDNNIVEPLQVLSDAGDIATVSKKNAYFLCEIMMTAGPRKKYMNEENADKDLGEDVCGFVSGSDEVLIWLLDGTSDLHCLKNPLTNREYFSSRLLALGIAERLKRGFIEKQLRPIGDMIAAAIKDVKDAWIGVINLLPADEKLHLKNNIENKNYPECATTLLIAQLNINGDFTAYRSGDSKMLLFGSDTGNELNFVETTLERKNDESNDRIFFRLRIDEEGKFDIINNNPLNEIVSEKNIKTIITFSDGIGMSTEQLLMEEYKTAPDQTRSEIIYRSQETGDDKSICFVEIKENR